MPISSKSNGTASRRRLLSPLSRSLILGVVVYASVMVGSYGWLVHQPMRQHFLDFETAEVQKLSKSIAGRLRSDLAGAIEELNYLAGLEALQSPDAKVVSASLRQYQRRTTYFKKFTVMDRAGRITARPSDPETIGQSRADRGYFEGTAQRRTTHVAEPQQMSAGLSISIGVPITSQSRQFLGVLAGHVALSDQHPRLCAAVTEITERRHYEVVLFSGSGHRIADSELGVAELAERNRRDHPLFGAAGPAALGPTTFELDGEEFFGVSQTIEPAGWVVIVQGRMAPILARVDSIVNQLAWIIGVVFLLMLAGAVFYAARIVRPITRLTSSLVHFGKSGEALPLADVGAADEVGEALEAFNQMVVDRSEVESRLLRQRGELQDLAGELSRFEQRMRREIASELHDHISQNLAATKIRLEMLREKQASEGGEESLSVAIALLTECIGSTSDLTKRLAPPSFDQIGLVGAVSSLVAEYQSQYDVEFEFEELGQLPCLTGVMAEAVYRGVCELLHNIIKHARATHAAVRMGHDRQTLSIEVADDGVGFVDVIGAEDSRVGGFGLFCLRERIRHFGGEFALRSSPGKGCVVTILVPLEMHDLQETG